MSEPWPPAFIRTAPPTEPGHADRPLEPGQPGGRRAPGEHGQGDAAAGRARRRSSPTSTAPISIARPARRSTRRCRGSRRRRRAGSSRGRRRAPGARGRGGPRRPRRRSSIERGRDEQRRRPADPVGGQRAERLVAPGTRPERSAATSTPSASVERARRRPASDRRAARRASTSSGSVAMSPQPIEMHTSPVPTSPARNDTRSSRRGSHSDARPGVGVEHGVDDQLPGDAGDRRRARRVDVGEHHDVGADEGVGVLGPHLGDAVVAVGLEGDDHPAPAVAAVAGGGEDGGDLRRQVGVVVDERGAAVDAADVEAPGDAAEAGRAPRGRPRTATPSSSAMAMAPVALTTLCTPRSGSCDRRRGARRARSTANGTSRRAERTSTARTSASAPRP